MESKLKYPNLPGQEPFRLAEYLQKQDSQLEEESENLNGDIFRAVKLKARLKEVKSQLFDNKEVLCLEMYEMVPVNKSDSHHLDDPSEQREEDMSAESQGDTKFEDSNKPRNSLKLNGDSSQQSEYISAGMAKKLREKKQEELQKIVQIRSGFESKEYPREFRYFQLLIFLAVLVFITWMYVDQSQNDKVLARFALHSQKLVYIKLLQRQEMTIGNRGRRTFLSRIKPGTAVYKMIYNSTDLEPGTLPLIPLAAGVFSFAVNSVNNITKDPIFPKVFEG